MKTSGASESAATSMLVKILVNAQQKADVIDIELRDEDEIKKKKEIEELAISYQIAKETALTQAEQQQYAEFLSQDYFTKDDFTKLEGFYANTWDRLTKDGQAEMSHRVWEGVRRDEYQFSELPEVVKEKEAQSLRESLGAGDKMSAELKAIPANDRADFIRTWDSGQRQESYDVLDRPSFKENVSTMARPITSKDAVESKPELASAVVLAERSKEHVKSSNPAASQLMGSMDFKLEDVPNVPSAPLPGVPQPSSPKARGQ